MRSATPFFLPCLGLRSEHLNSRALLWIALIQKYISNHQNQQLKPQNKNQTKAQKTTVNKCWDRYIQVSVSLGHELHAGTGPGLVFTGGSGHMINWSQDLFIIGRNRDSVEACMAPSQS
jgi:hypothetical protein